MPIFVRPMMRGSFKSKAGQSLQDWKVSAVNLLNLVEQIASGDNSSLVVLKKDAARWKTLLNKLDGYYLAMPAGAAAITKDKEFLNIVKQQSDERSVVVRSVIGMLVSC